MFLDNFIVIYTYYVRVISYVLEHIINRESIKYSLSWRVEYG